MATTTLPKIHVTRIPTPGNTTLTHAFQVTCTACPDLTVTLRTRGIADQAAIAHQHEHASGDLLDRLLAAHDQTPTYIEDVAL